jgi:hypothetical protein
MGNEGDTKVLMTAGGGNRRMPLARFVNSLTQWIRKWADTFPSHAITEIQIGTYIEALSDLTEAQLEAACREVTKSAEQFPKPAHIRAALRRLEAVPRSRPNYLDEPVLPASERWGEEEQSASDKLRAQIGLRPSKPRVVDQAATGKADKSEESSSR